jgi:broad specificity phosphatase PhoE
MDSGFYFVRHGESVNNKLKLVNGWTDCTLTEFGETSTKDIALDLKKYSINRIITSDLQRTVKTSQIISTCIGNIPYIEQYFDLRERNWGIYENKPIKDRPGLDITPENGESWPVFFNRVSSTLKGLDIDSETLIVGHSGTMRVLINMFKIEENINLISNTKPVLFFNENNTWGYKFV